MATIDELMEGKKPGEIRIKRKNAHWYFIPYFRAFGRGIPIINEYWFGIQVFPNDEKQVEAACEVELDDWQLYTEPTNTVVSEPEKFIDPGYFQSLP